MGGGNGTKRCPQPGPGGCSAEAMDLCWKQILLLLEGSFGGVKRRAKGYLGRGQGCGGRKTPLGEEAGLVSVLSSLHFSTVLVKYLHS